MKSHRRLISPENPVNFLKIILSDDSPSTGIRLPEKFTVEYGKCLSESVKLKVRNGDVWQVDLHKSGDEIWLKNGWGKFAEHYGLGFSNFLMFKYEGDSTFGMIIFNASASEIEYPETTDHLRNSVQRDARKRPVSWDESKIVILDDDSSSSWREDQEHGIKMIDEGEGSRKRQITQWQEEKRALDEAKNRFKRENPFFMVYMKPSYLARGGLYVPAEFRRKWLLRHRNSRKCLLQLGDQDDGEMKIYNVVAHKKYLGNADWLMFVEDNGLRVGDVCVLELVHKDKNVLGVTIFRSGS